MTSGLIPIILIAIFLLFTPKVIHAQTATTSSLLYKESNTWITAVGNAQLPLGPRDEVIIWATQISNALQLGTYVFPGMSRPMYNKMLANIKNGSYTAARRTGEQPNAGPLGLYWCTYIVVDAYNLAGIPGLNVFREGAVNAMILRWKTYPDYNFIDYQTNKQVILSIPPGSAMFFQYQPGSYSKLDHVVLVKYIQINSIGDGFIETYESNNVMKIGRYVFDNWNITNPPNARSGVILVGFGN